MSATSVAVAAGTTVALSPYLARLVSTVPDRDNRAWWRGEPAGRGRLAATMTIALVLGALAGLAAGWEATLPALIALALFATPLTMIDIETHRLPDRLVVTAAVVALALFAVAAATQHDWAPYLRALEAAAAVFAVLFALTLAAPGSFGFGDVKLGALLGGYLGWVGWAVACYGIFAGFLLGTVVAVILLITGRAGRKTAIPFGPTLVLGALTVLVLHQVSGVLH
jgi:leader peptidase (prepilin peptidase)/N-methyltransferase